MTKGQFIYLVKTFFEGGDGGTGGSSKWHLGDIERYCEMAFADTVEQLYRQAIQYHDWTHIDPITKTYYNVSIAKDTVAGEYVGALPVSVLQLPESGGVRAVWIGGTKNLHLVHIPNNAEGVYDEIEKYDGRGFVENAYYIEGQNIRIPCRPQDDLSEVNMSLIRSLAGYEETEEMPTVFGKDGVVFRMVIQLMSGMFPSDDVNDSSSKKVVQNG
jgi:hypothetical protein